MNVYQKHFLHIISTQLPEGTKLVDFLSEVIHLGKEACYRRIRCEVEFTLSEVVAIAKVLNINLTSLIIREGGEKVTCNLRIAEEETAESSYVKKLEAELNVLEGFERRINPSIYNVCKEPLELFYFDLKGLVKLRLLRLTLDQGGSELITFDKIQVSPVVEEFQLTYWEAIRHFRITCFLAPDLFNALICDINYLYKTNRLESQDLKYLKTELLELLSRIDSIAKTGKYREKEIEMYWSHLTFDIGHRYLKSEGLEATTIELGYPNTLLSFDKAFSRVQQSRLEKIKRTSTLITQSGELDRVNFINKQRELINSIGE